MADGRADVAMGPLNIWVIGLQRDGDPDPDKLLFISAEYRMLESRVRVEGAILLGEAVEHFLHACRALYSTLRGEAVLSSLEPHLRVALSGNGRGHVQQETRLTPDWEVEDHTFRTLLDQTYLPTIIGDCERLLRRFSPGSQPEGQGVEQ